MLLLNAQPVAAQPASAPKPVGPYSPAVAAGDLIFLSGQIALDPSTGRIDRELSIEAQTLQIWSNIRAVLKPLGLGLEHVVQAQVFLTDISEFAAMNGAYSKALGECRPARTTVGVKALPLGAKIEIAVIASRQKPATLCAEIKP
jgi:2-iminobutanoate/2-iminopropanoate deaminase